MPTVSSVMAELKNKGTEKTRKIYARHGMATGKMFGVSVADLKVIAKTIKGQQALASELYATGNMDAMYLAGMVADGSQMTPKQLNEWVEGAENLQMIAEYTVPWVTVENPHARDLAIEWIKSKKEHVASSGWSTYSGLVATKPDEALDLAEISSLLGAVVQGIKNAKNRVRYTMNGFVIAVGGHVKPLAKQAKATARQIGVVSVDLGDTACNVPLATAYIEKIEAAGRVGQKRKTIRC
ncbi:MAG TPA: DNA alkylation repair protein [Candidatus Cybelea sp.]|jgi:3-methyladenine DNA glycosylase AlkD|nr:DNA alkylation repair protein [Candidatus Cybelea sp.]